MPLEVRELVVKVDVGTPAPAAARRLAEQEIAALKRQIIATCLAELRQQLATRHER